jgi:hypothetical protein
MKKVIELLANTVVILVVCVLIAACTTAPLDVEVPEENLCIVCYCPVGFHRRSGGMYDLARETKRKVDEAMWEKEVRREKGN